MFACADQFVLSSIINLTGIILKFLKDQKKQRVDGHHQLTKPIASHQSFGLLLYSHCTGEI